VFRTVGAPWAAAIESAASGWPVTTEPAWTFGTFELSRATALMTPWASAAARPRTVASARDACWMTICVGMPITRGPGTVAGRLALDVVLREGLGLGHAGRAVAVEPPAGRRVGRGHPPAVVDVDPADRGGVPALGDDALHADQPDVRGAGIAAAGPGRGVGVP